ALERDRHGLLAHDVLSRARRLDAVLGVQSRWRGDRDDVAFDAAQHVTERREPRNGVRLARRAGALGNDVGDADELELGDAGDRLEVIPADAPASNEGD